MLVSSPVWQSLLGELSDLYQRPLGSERPDAVHTASGCPLLSVLFRQQKQG